MFCNLEVSFANRVQFQRFSGIGSVLPGLARQHRVKIVARVVGLAPDCVFRSWKQMNGQFHPQVAGFGP